MGDDKKPLVPLASVKSSKTRKSMSTKKMYWALVDYVEQSSIDPKDGTVEDLLDLIKDDVLLETR